MTIRPASSALRLPRSSGGQVTPVAFDTAMQLTEMALQRVPQQGSTPSFPGIILTAQDGSSWRLLVNPSGALYTTQVP